MSGSAFSEAFFAVSSDQTMLSYITYIKPHVEALKD